MKIRKQFNNKDYYKGKEMDSISQTVPDQTLSIRDLLERHSRGLPLDAPTLKGEYFDTEIPRFDDLTDMLKYKQTLMDRKKQLDTQIKEERALQKAKKAPSPKGETASTPPDKAQSKEEIISGTE